MSDSKKGGKNKKYGRNSAWCQVYKSRHTEAKNKEAKLRRHIKKFPNDTGAVSSLKNL